MSNDRTAEGHLVGMLDRDPRTAKLPIFSEHVLLSTFYEGFPRAASLTVSNRRPISHVPVRRRASPHSSCKTRKNGHHLWKFLQRLEHALIVGTCISIIALLPCISTAPTTNRQAMESRFQSHPRWINPLGIDVVNNSAQDTNIESRILSDEQLLKQIVFQANTAYDRTREFGEDFVTRTFKKSWAEHHNLWKHTDYDWLPTNEVIPKKLEEPVPAEHLKDIEFQNALLDTYTYLQKISVGLEQIVLDMREQNDPFLKNFEKTDNLIVALLCEIQAAIYEHNYKMNPDVQRNIMSDELRKMDTTRSNVRNWVIYRDCLTVLEYVRDVFVHLKSKI